MDFTADGTKLLVSCEFANRVAVLDVTTHRLVKTIPLTHVVHGMPQDVKLAADGTLFFVADMTANGVYIIDAATLRVIRFRPTGAGAHGLYVSRDSRRLFVTNRAINSSTGHLIAKIPVGSGPHGLCVGPLPGRYSLGHTGILR